MAVCFNSMSLPPDQELVENHERKAVLNTELSSGILKSLGNAERHFNNLENGVRKTCVHLVAREICGHGIHI